MKDMTLEMAEERKVQRMIEVELNDAEKAELHNETHRITGEILAEEDKKKAINSTIKGLEDQRDKMILKMTGNKEVECVQKTFFENNIVQVWHGDKMIEERALTPEERQMSISEIKNGVVMDEDEEASA